MSAALAPLSVAERFDFLGQAFLFFDRDPLEHLDPLLELRDFVAKPQIFGTLLGIERAFAPAIAAVPAIAVLRADDRREHDDRDDDDSSQLTVIHLTSSSGKRSRSRRASI